MATELPLVPASDLGLWRKKQILEAWAAANENMHLSTLWLGETKFVKRLFLKVVAMIPQTRDPLVNKCVAQWDKCFKKVHYKKSPTCFIFPS